MTDAVTLQVMEAGASGIFFLKHRDPDQLVTAIHRVRTRALNSQILVDHSRSRINLRSSLRQVATHP
jgi:DNA-binding NarL/FixJ family response regulator